MSRKSLIYDSTTKMDHRQVRCEYVDCIQLIYGKSPVMGFYEHRNEPSGSVEAGNSLIG
jgi:hypothetical protein